MILNRRVFNGVGASPGLSIGKVCLLPDFETSVPRRSITNDELSSEIIRFEKACERSKNQIQELLESSHLPEEYRAIFEAQIFLLEDPMLIHETKEKVKSEHYNPEWALATVIDSYRKIMNKTSDIRFRERMADVEDIANRILSNLMGITESDIRIPFLMSLNENDILIAEELSPSLLLWIRKKIAGIVTEKGGVTGHTAILARDRGIPALVGVDNLLNNFSGGEVVFIDGDNGVFITNPDDSDLEDFLKYYKESRNTDNVYSPVKKSDGDIRIWINLDDLNTVINTHLQNLHGVGLFRTEFLYLNHPDLFTCLEEQIELYKKILIEADGKPITFRMLDIGDDKTFNIPLLTHANITQEIGDLRGIRFLLEHRNILQSQLRSIFQAAIELDYPEQNCRIMLPMVSTLEEIHEFKKEVRAILSELKNDQKRFPLGIMIETPAACIMTDVFEKEADFFSFGTNDLAHITLSLNRVESEHQKNLFYQPSVIRMMKLAIDKTSLPISVCGEIAGLPAVIPVLIGLGIRDLSVSWSSAMRITPTLEALEIAGTSELAQKVLQCSSADEMKEVLELFRI
ncbi:MAG: phosphoenolpyruvate--protein phosphotransferase [Spirochaetia bacterium]|nr:phosphoenolpyruvate--protein phosphotransferase [Spirochaetia bacterium]